MRCLVSGDTRPRVCKTRSTVPIETPARLAISITVIQFAPISMRVPTRTMLIEELQKSRGASTYPEMEVNWLRSCSSHERAGVAEGDRACTIEICVQRAHW